MPTAFVSTEENPRPRFGMFGSLRRASDSLRAMISSRLELMILEFREEKSRLVSVAIFGAAMAVFGFMALIAITAALVVYFRDHALAVLLGLGTFYLVGTIGFGLMLRKRVKSPLFRETVAQLKKDKAELL